MNDQGEQSPVRLAEAVARRICHDFAGLLGTLGGTLELVGEEPEAAALALETSQALSARVRLLRAAWGGTGESLEAADVLAMARGLPGFERLHTVCEGFAPPLEGDAARLCLCLLLAAAAALPRGGHIRVAGAAGCVVVDIDGQGATWPPVLTGPAAAAWEAAETPREAAAGLCRLLTDDAGWTLNITSLRATCSSRVNARAN